MAILLSGNSLSPPLGQRLAGRRHPLHRAPRPSWGIAPSVGSRGDSDDHALAETINGLYKADLIHRRAAWETKDAVERATHEGVSWFNHHRLLEPIGSIPPDEVNDYRQRPRRPKTRSNLNQLASTKPGAIQLQKTGR